jgi:hypothetical protein
MGPKAKPLPATYRAHETVQLGGWMRREISCFLVEATSAPSHRAESSTICGNIGQNKYELILDNQFPFTRIASPYICCISSLIRFRRL